jgi:hypothetical protein
MPAAGSLEADFYQPKAAARASAFLGFIGVERNSAGPREVRNHN